MSAVRFGVVGFGGMGRGRARRAAEMGGVQVTAAVDTSKEARARAEEEHELTAFETVEEMLEADVVDAVYIATPNKFHAGQSIRCMEGGVDVFCEKPMAMCAEEGRRMIETARKTGRKLTINLSYRADGHARALKSVVDEGLLGQIYFARTRWMRNRGIPWRGWFGDRELAGGGPLIDLGVHRIDLALWLMGHPQPVAVTGTTYGMLGRRIAEEHGQDYSVEDLAAGFVRFKNGASLSLEASWATNSEWREDMSTSVYGLKAGATHRSVGGTYEFEARVWGEIGDTFAETVLHPISGAGHLEAFLDAVRGEGPVPVDPEDALKVQMIIDALYRSAAEGGEVRLEG